MLKRTTLSMMSMIVCLGLLASSCASPPNEARTAAEQAIQDARNGDAEKYAEEAFNATVEEFNKAEKHMTAKEFGEARTSYEKVIELATTAGKETGIGRELSKVDANTKLDEFLASWSEISKQIEKGRGRKAKALAGEAKAFGDSLSGTLTELKSGEQWYELLAALEEANTAAMGFKERAGGN